MATLYDGKDARGGDHPSRRSDGVIFNKRNSDFDFPGDGAVSTEVQQLSGRAALALVVSAVLVLAVQLSIWVLVLVPGTYVKGPSVIGSCLVDLNYTIYEGLQLSNGVNAFLGMRYAAPPVGDLRWRAPVEPLKTGTVEKATRFPPICLGIDMGYPSAGQDEDCLFVNVWAPANATTQSKLPVWVFIQGGGYVANTNANWDGAEVVQKSGHNIIMVNFNYRVGLWGFLASERVRADGALNAGLLDQRMLLKWVKTHIASFGGDPNHVVIHGASAGAGSVAMHLVACGGRNDNLFVGGMAESIFFPAQPFVRELEYQFDRVASQTGCDELPPDRQMACLRSKDVALLQAANHAQAFPGRSEPPMPLFYWTPCIDGDLLRDLPYNLFRKGHFISVPMLFGTSTNEGSVFAADAATKEDVARFLADNYPKLTPNDTDAILALYPQLPALPHHNAWFPTASQAYGEATFICPQTNVLDALLLRSPSKLPPPSPSSPTGSPSPSLFAYRFNVHDDANAAQGLGVPHLFDAAAIFGPTNIGGSANSYATYNAPVVPLMMAYVTSFVRALDPNVHRLPGSSTWGPWGGGAEGEGMARLVVETGGRTRMERVPEGERERCRFWWGMGRVLEQK
ncbi:hypothetical protein VTK56DRAFT_310 [Thermocarpiscus australiensis]